MTSHTHLIFDFDRTIATLLIDWAAWHQGVAAILRRYEPSFAEERHQAFVPYTTQNALIRKHGAPLSQELTAFVRYYEQQHLQGVVAVDATVQWIKEQRGKELFIWSSNSRQTVLPALELLQLHDLFAKIVCREDVLCTKPDPEGFYRIREAGVASERYLFIGDNPHVDEPAAAAAAIAYWDVSQIPPRHSGDG